MKPLTVLFLLILPVLSLFSQTDTLFWFAAPDVSSEHGTAPKNGAPILLHIVAEDAANVTISQPANNSFVPITFQLAENEHRSLRLDTSLSIDQIENYPVSFPVTPGNVQKKAFKITSDGGNISVYYDLDNPYNKEIFTLKGRNAMGKNFFVSTQNYFPNGVYSGTAWSGFVIAATENNTRIVVFPNDDWLFFDTNPGDSLVLTLNAGETFAFRAVSTASNLHINGVPVKSDKDIVITFYDDSIRKKNSLTTNCAAALSYDIIGDQLVPVSRIGKEYVVVKGDLTNVVAPNCPADGGERIFITSTQPNTVLIINGVPVDTILLEGQVVSYPVETNSLHLLASKPVYVMHITGFGGEVGGALLPSVDNCSGSEKITFIRSPNINDAFRINLAVRNETNYNHIKSIDAFTLYTNFGWTSVPNTFFDYNLDSTWIVLKKTPEVSAYLSNNIEPGLPVVIQNSVSAFHMGLINGSNSTGAKYGYVTSFSPNPVKDIRQSKDSLKVVISSKIFDGDWEQDEWLILKITDTITNVVWYDTTAVVTKTHGFQDTVYVDSGTYKCEIIDMGANVEMPVIKVDDEHIVPFGYPEYEYYLFTLPGNYPTENTIWRTQCDSLVSPSGNYTWYSGGTYYDTIPNADGYDSLLTINLTLNYSTSAILNETACFSYVSPAGNIYENSGTYYETIMNAVGCDSSITINLIVNKPDKTVETIEGTMKAAEEDASYQWLVCASGLDIEGATDQMYTPAITGLYAVRITKEGCSVISNCNLITGIDHEITVPEISYYPNPVSDELHIDLKAVYVHIELRITDMAGRMMLQKEFEHRKAIQVETRSLSSGLYTVQLLADGKPVSFKLAVR